MPRGNFAVIPMDVVCASCGETFRRCHGKFPKYCSVQCRPPTDVAAKIARFSERVASGCVEWRGSLLRSGGYGQLAVDGKPQRAHRVAYELANGPIPRGLFVCHRCDNPKCINVEHLFLGTNADNMHDCKTKGRAGMPLKFTEQQISTMHAMREAGASYAAISREIGVGYSTVYGYFYRA